jgi:RNA polymerase sigma-70 factor (ECF subfamily)
LDADIPGELIAMRRYARALTRDDQDADDVVQDAILRAIERNKSFKPEFSRRGWLLAIVHNVFISSKRREAAEARRNDRFAETLERNPDLEQEQRVRLSRVASAYASLPEHHRTVLHLTAVEGLTYQEVADVLDVPVGTVMSRLSRAREALKQRELGPSPLRIVGEANG